VKNKTKKKIHKDKYGREFIKETYFVGGKMEHNRVYVVDGIPVDEFYEKNGIDLDFYLNGDYELMSCNKVSENLCNDQNINESNVIDNEDSNDLPF